MAGSKSLPCWESKHSLRVSGQVVLQEARMPRPAEIRSATAWSRSNHLSPVKHGSRLRPPHSHAHKRFGFGPPGPAPSCAACGSRCRDGAGLVHGRVYRRSADAPPRAPRPPGGPGAAAHARSALLEGMGAGWSTAPLRMLGTAAPSLDLFLTTGVLGLLSSRHASALTASVCKPNNATCQSRGSVRGNAVPTQEGRRHPGALVALTCLHWYGQTEMQTCWLKVPLA